MKKCLTKLPNGLYHFKGGKRVNGANDKMFGDCSGLRGDCSFFRGECSFLSGDCTFLRGECSGLSGECTFLLGDLDLITEKGREKHPNLDYWIKK